MIKLVKALHVLGVVLFFGSILGHAVVGLAETVHDSAQTRFVARQIIDAATWYLTVPGLALLALTGLGMIIMRGKSLLGMRWMVVHLTLAGLVLLNAILVLLPTGHVILAAANELAAGAGKTADMLIAEKREAVFGAINILLCLTAVFTGVVKPHRGRKAS